MWGLTKLDLPNSESLPECINAVTAPIERPQRPIWPQCSTAMCTTCTSFLESFRGQHHNLVIVAENQSRPCCKNSHTPATVQQKVNHVRFWKFYIDKLQTARSSLSCHPKEMYSPWFSLTLWNWGYSKLAFPSSGLYKKIQIATAFRNIKLKL